jgi:hypothetical protein
VVVEDLSVQYDVTHDPAAATVPLGVTCVAVALSDAPTTVTDVPTAEYAAICNPTPVAARTGTVTLAPASLASAVRRNTPTCNGDETCWPISVQPAGVPVAPTAVLETNKSSVSPARTPVGAVSDAPDATVAAFTYP